MLIQKKPTRGVLLEKAFQEISQNSQEYTCAGASFFIKLQAQACIFIKKETLACNFIKKETLAQAFPCEFCEIFKKTFSTEHLWTTASSYKKRAA